tara:strand:+ start:3386 stop:3943 length:558 start_codon:yes stop_codon:yes gene_type:complete
MSYFDLNNYLAENKLLSEDHPKGEYGIYKFEFPDKSTKYIKSSQTFTPKTTLGKWVSQAAQKPKHGGASSFYQKINQLENPLEDLVVTFIQSSENEEEALNLLSKLSSEDPDSLGSSRMTKTGSKAQTITLPKSDSLTSNGEFYIAASKLNKYPELKDKVDMKSKLNHPIKGLYYKITTDRVNRI